jgi:hypothetical protein
MDTLETPCHSVQVEDCHKRQSWRREGSDTDLMRSLNSRELRLWTGQWFVSPTSVVRREPRHQRIAVETEHSVSMTHRLLGRWICLPAKCGLLQVTRALSPGPADELGSTASSLLQGGLLPGEV